MDLHRGSPRAGGKTTAGVAGPIPRVIHTRHTRRTPPAAPDAGGAPGDPATRPGGGSVAIGNFDGVHRGHQALLARARETAATLAGDVSVLTFDPHPARVLQPSLAPPLLCALPRKIELLFHHDADAVVVAHFDRELAALSPDAFVEHFLIDELAVRDVVVGFDFSYGHKRAGTPATLAAAGARLGFSVHVVPPVAVAGVVASSTKVRELLLQGDVRGAHALLGRPHDVDGVVVRGAQRGRALGYPTANVAATSPTLLPRNGIYATRLAFLDEKHPRGVALPSVASLGTNPTFDGTTTTLEVHVFDLDEDLYGRPVRVMFEEHLRDERRFDDVAALVAQMDRDAALARDLLGKIPPSDEETR